MTKDASSPCYTKIKTTLRATPAFLDDYAFWAEGLLTLSSVSEWIEPGSSFTYLQDAETFASKAMDAFRDEQSAGFFFAPKDLDCPAPGQKKFWYDNAIPSGNSSMLRVFATLYHLTGEASWQRNYCEARNAYSALVPKSPHGIGHALTAIAENEIGLCCIKADEKDWDDLAPKPCRKAPSPGFPQAGRKRRGKTGANGTNDKFPGIRKLRGTARLPLQPLGNYCFFFSFSNNRLKVRPSSFTTLSATSITS